MMTVKMMSSSVHLVKIKNGSNGFIINSIVVSNLQWSVAPAGNIKNANLAKSPTKNVISQSNQYICFN